MSNLLAVMLGEVASTCVSDGPEEGDVVISKFLAVMLEFVARVISTSSRGY